MSEAEPIILALPQGGVLKIIYKSDNTQFVDSFAENSSKQPPTLNSWKHLETLNSWKLGVSKNDNPIFYFENVAINVNNFLDIYFQFAGMFAMGNKH